jgi:hypothetical protein
MRFSSVIMPEPKNPLRTVTGMRVVSLTTPACVSTPASAGLGATRADEYYVAAGSTSLGKRQPAVDARDMDMVMLGRSARRAWEHRKK